MNTTETQDAWQFGGISQPGWSQIPNELFDEIQPRVDAYTFSVVAAIFREYFGWHASAPRPLSLSELTQRTNLSRHRVIKSIKEAEACGIIVCVRRVEDGQNATNRYAPRMREEAPTAPDAPEGVHGAHQGSAPDAPGVVHGAHQGSAPRAPGGSAPGALIQRKGKETLKETESEGADAPARAPLSPPEAPAEIPEPPGPDQSTQASPSESKSKTKKKRARDPLLDHAAVQAYRDVARLTPAAAARPLIADAVGEAEADVGFWRQVVQNWIATGWNARNLSGMLEFYGRRQLPGTTGRAASGPTANGQVAAPSARTDPNQPYKIKRRETRHVDLRPYAAQD
ncbi:MAG: hypothetical protein JXB47_20865 [Anaerolineae bacterium]|nr:hypothetical protein [Anaerolineae bacterium]